jgi:hypothetical protein
MWSNRKNTTEENQERNKSKILQNYGSSSTFIWQRNMDTEREKDWNRIQAVEMKYLRTVKGCTRLDQIRNEELGISHLS